MTIQYPTKAPRGCFVYLFRVDGVPRYIGKGRGKRHTEHEKAARGKSRTPWHNFLRRAIAESRAIAVEIVADGLTDAEAFDHENFAVEQYGRVFDKTGSLLNWHAGGKGGDSASVRASHARPHVRRRLSEVQLNAWANPNYRILRAEIAKEVRNRPDVVKKLSRAVSAAWRVPGKKETWSANISAAVNAPACKAIRSAKNKAIHGAPEYRRKQSAISREIHSRPEVKKKHADAVRLAINTPEAKAKRSASQREAWKNPAIRERRTAALRAAAARKKQPCGQLPLSP